VVAFVTVLMWPAREGGNGPTSEVLSFHPFQEVAHVEFDRSDVAFTRLEPDGHRVFVAWELGGDLHVRAYSVTTGDEEWRADVTG
jgi:hypothetical protein